MGQWKIGDWTTGELNALVRTVGEENARNMLASSQILHLATVPNVMEYVDSVHFPAIERELYASDLDTGDLIAVGKAMRQSLLPVTYPLRGLEWIRYRMKVAKNTSEVYQAIKPNHIMPESLNHLQLRLEQLIKHRQPHGEPGILSTAHCNCFPVQINSELYDTRGGILFAVWQNYTRTRKYWTLEVREADTTVTVPADSLVFCSIRDLTSSVENR